jgi:hypothetical protein
MCTTRLVTIEFVDVCYGVVVLLLVMHVFNHSPEYCIEHKVCKRKQELKKCAGNIFRSDVDKNLNELSLKILLASLKLGS